MKPTLKSIPPPLSLTHTHNHARAHTHTHTQEREREGGSTTHVHIPPARMSKKPFFSVLIPLLSSHRTTWFRVYGLGSRFQCTGSRAQGLGFRV